MKNLIIFCIFWVVFFGISHASKIKSENLSDLRILAESMDFGAEESFKKLDILVMDLIQLQKIADRIVNEVVEEMKVEAKEKIKEEKARREKEK